MFTDQIPLSNTTFFIPHPSSLESFTEDSFTSSQESSCFKQGSHLALEWQALTSIVQVVFCGALRFRTFSSSIVKVVNSWSSYMSDEEKNIESLARSLSKVTLSESSSEPACNFTISGETSCVPMVTGNVTGNCLYINPVVYDVHASTPDSLDKNWYNTCIQSLSKNCLSNCLGCNNVSDLYFIETNNITFGSYGSSNFPGRRWSITTFSPEEIDEGTASAVFFTMSRFIDTCEKEDIQDKIQDKKNYIITISIAGGVIGIFALGALVRCYLQRPKKSPTEESSSNKQKPYLTTSTTNSGTSRPSNDAV